MTARVFRVEPDHFLVDDGNGWLPHMDANLSPEDHAKLTKMCSGGDVPHYAEGVESVRPAQDSRSEFADPIRPPVQGEQPQDFAPESDADRMRAEFAARAQSVPPPNSTTITLPDGTKIQHGAQAPTTGYGDQPFVDETGAEAFPRPAPPPVDPNSDAERMRAEFAKLKAGGAPTPPKPPEFKPGGFEPLGSQIVQPPAIPVAQALPSQPVETAAAPAVAAPIPPISAPKSPGVGSGGGTGPEDLKKLTTQDASDRQALATKQGDLATLIAGHLQTQTDELKKISENYAKGIAENVARQKYLQSQEIDPQRALREMGPFNNTLALIGLALGTFGSSLTNSPNTALQIYNNMIERDIRAQEKNQEKNLRINETDRIRLHEEYQQKHADALSLVSNILDQERAKAAPGIESAKAQLDSDTFKLHAIKLGDELVNSRKDREVKDWQIANIKNANQVARDAQKNQQETVKSLVKEGYEPGSAAALTHIIFTPELQLKHHVEYHPPPLLDARGLPRYDAGGALVRERPTGRYLQAEGSRAIFEKNNRALDTLQDSLGKLVQLADRHPEGIALDFVEPVDAAAADSLKARMSTQLKAEGLEALGQITGGDQKLIDSQIAGLNVWGGVGGGTLAKLRGLQDYITSTREANDRSLFHPERMK